MRTKEEKKETSKYAVKPPKDLASKFEAKLAAKAREEEEALEKKRRDEEATKIAVRIDILLELKPLLAVANSIIGYFCKDVAHFYNIG